MRSVRILIVSVLLAAAGAASAQQSAQPSADPIGDNFFPPELVMAHQQDIHLSDAQRDSIVAAVAGAQQRATELQWKLQNEVDKMITLVRQPAVNEEQVLAQLDKVLAVEREIKRLHLTVVVRIRNQLTMQQRISLGFWRDHSGNSGAH